MLASIERVLDLNDSRALLSLDSSNYGQWSLFSGFHLTEFHLGLVRKNLIFPEAPLGDSLHFHTLTTGVVVCVSPYLCLDDCRFGDGVGLHWAVFESDDQIKTTLNCVAWVYSTHFSDRR